MISFVLQGPVEPSTQECVDSVKHHYPESEIIVASTNLEGSYLTSVDKIVYAGHDTETIEHTPHLNKQIASSQAVKKANYQIVCKIRNDIIFVNDHLFSFIDRELGGKLSIPRMESNRLFDKFVLCGHVHFSNPEVSGLYFHPSDWLFLGMKTDLEKLFSIPFQTNITGKVQPQYRAEQYILIKALQANGIDVDIERYDEPYHDPAEERNWMINNFYVVDVGWMGGFWCRKYPTLRDGPVIDNQTGEDRNCLCHTQWNELHNAMMTKDREQ